VIGEISYPNFQWLYVEIPRVPLIDFIMESIPAKSNKYPYVNHQPLIGGARGPAQIKEGAQFKSEYGFKNGTYRLFFII